MILLAGSFNLFFILTKLKFFLTDGSSFKIYIIFSKLMNPLSLQQNFDLIKSLTLKVIKFMFLIPLSVSMPFPAFTK